MFPLKKALWIAAIGTLPMILTSKAWAFDESTAVRANAAEKQTWSVPKTVPHPEDNKPTPARVALGKKLFFDPRLSGDANMSCATCHNPSLGWSDGLSTGRGFRGAVLGRATPTIINTALNPIQMWDGRFATLEEQALGPMGSEMEMHSDIAGVVTWLNNNSDYRSEFEKAYPNEPITEKVLAKAIASFERTVISKDSKFDRWLAGNGRAMSAAELRGFRAFVDPNKGNCAACHVGPNFTDNGFHNIGIAQAGKADPGRFAVRKVNANKGAFKTPTLRDIALTAPYFHDGSAKTLMEVVEHYERGGDDKSNLAANMKPQLTLSAQDKQDLVAFMQALSSKPKKVDIPALTPSDRAHSTVQDKKITAEFNAPAVVKTSALE